MRKKYYIDLGKRLTKVWRALGIDLKDIAKAAGIAPGYLTDLCKGNRTNPGIAVIYKIAKHYRVSLDYLLLGEGEMFLPDKDIEEQKRKNFEPVFNTIDDLVWLMKRSSFLKNTILGMAVKLYMENKEIVTRELLMPEEKKEDALEE
jgi:transcriptional regulator with XRE-family HTH domain